MIPRGRYLLLEEKGSFIHGSEELYDETIHVPRLSDVRVRGDRL